MILPPPHNLEQLLAALRRYDGASARDLAHALGKSQPTVSRLLSDAGSAVARWGRARRTRYASTRNVRGLGTHWPLYQIDARGQAHAFGELVALHGEACLIRAEHFPDWFRGEFVDGHFPGLPWFMDDMRPQGFLGRQFAHRAAQDLGLPDDIHRWGVDAILTSLILRGADTAGHFILGDRALQAAQHPVADPILGTQRQHAYAKLAEQTMAGEVFGSSAAGEQPKFTACVTQHDGTMQHVIVKFTDRITDNPIAQRWADLLMAEHLALRVLSDAGHASAATALVNAEGRLCLEVNRFDRRGGNGRIGTVALAAWSDAHDGVRDGWPKATARMEATGWIGADSALVASKRWWFGKLIGNTDMHFGNLTFYLNDQLPLSLAPAYDMLPMCYAPGVGGRLPMPVLSPAPPAPAERDAWHWAAVQATTYWHTLADADTHELGKALRVIAAQNAQAVESARKHA